VAAAAGILAHINELREAHSGSLRHSNGEALLW
jgi:hypothetical protein